jgi:N-acetylglucosamine-6-phosphate deacetylase
VLITDSLRVKHLDDGKYTEPSGQVIIKDGGVARLEDGTIAGSILKMNEAVKNILDNTNVSFIDAVNFATANPAKNLRMFDKMGSISVGKLANLLVVDKDINIYKTIVKGKILYEKSED